VLTAESADISPRSVGNQRRPDSQKARYPRMRPSQKPWPERLRQVSPVLRLVQRKRTRPLLRPVPSSNRSLPHQDSP
jgi:hypothetical protein